MIRGLLLDCNNTIESPGHTYARRATMAETMARQICGLGVECDAADIVGTLIHFDKRYRRFVWEHHPVFWREVIRRSLGPRRLNEKLLDDVYDAYLDFYEDSIQLYPDVLPFLAEHTGRRRLGLVANGNAARLRRLLRKDGLGEHFDATFLSSESPYQKPNRFVFDYVLDAMSLAPGDALVVGDRFDTDIEGARRAGIPAVHISRSDWVARGPVESVGPLVAEVATLAELSCVLDESAFVDAVRRSQDAHEAKPRPATAIVLAGGRGRRMGDVCSDRQKVMLPLSDRPMLDYTMRLLVGVGCREVVLSVDHCADEVREWVGDGRRYGMEVKYSEGVKGSTLQSVLRALDQTHSDEFIYLHGNVILQPSALRSALAAHERTGTSVLVTKEDPREIRHARISAEAGEPPRIDCSQTTTDGLLFVGLAVYERSLFEDECLNRAGTMTEYAAAVHLREGGFVEVLKMDEAWFHFEDMRDYDYAADKTASELIFKHGD